jgi:hypothetical protein
LPEKTTSDSRIRVVCTMTEQKPSAKNMMSMPVLLLAAAESLSGMKTLHIAIV